MLLLRKLNKHYSAARLLLGLAILILAPPILVNTYLDLPYGTDTGDTALTRVDPETTFTPVETDDPAHKIGYHVVVNPETTFASVGTEGPSSPGADNKTPARFDYNISVKMEHDSQINEKDSVEPGSADPAKPSSESPPVKPKPADKAALPARGKPAGVESKTEQPTPPPQPVSDYDTDLNGYVQQIITTYNGYYPYLLNTDYANYNGVSEDLYFDNRLLAKAHPSGNRATHCVGITFEVFFKAMQARNQKLGLSDNDFNGMTFDELYDFLLIWYVAGGNKQVSNIEVAVEKYGLGKRINSFEKARAGDFMDISRSNGTGHKVIFQNWIRSDSGQITGVRYWSSQDSGIGINTEYFDNSGRGNVCSKQVYIARVLPVHQYKSFR